MASKKIAVLIGSLRKESFTRKIALETIALAPASLAPVIIDLSHLSIYNQDDDEGTHVPTAWSGFREKMQGMDGVLFFTAEYNRSVPAVLKNAIDVGSRPYGQSIWSGKPAAIMSVSPGPVGGFGANHHLRQSLVFLDLPCMQQPESYIGGVTALLDEDGKVNNDATRKSLRTFIEAYAVWVERLAGAA
jgi:chromate reductase